MQDLCPNKKGIVWLTVTKHTIMIRKNSLFCKLIRIKSSSKTLFDTFMAGFQAEREVCPACGASHSCSVHASYERNLIDFVSGSPVYSTVTVTRVLCSGCGHTHAVLPDLVIPYSTYGLFFILRVIAEYFLHFSSVEALCLRFGISHAMLYRWLSLFREHKSLWLGVLASAEITPLSFMKDICSREYSAFASRFTCLASVSFLQSHRDPAVYRQTVF